MVEIELADMVMVNVVHLLAISALQTSRKARHKLGEIILSMMGHKKMIFCKYKGTITCDFDKFWIKQEHRILYIRI